MQRRLQKDRGPGVVSQLIEQVYRHHRQGLFTLALSITGRADQAEDAVHDAVVRLCRKDVAPTGDAVAYVFAAVRNAALDLRRKPRLVKTAVSIFEVGEMSGPESAGAGVDAAERAGLVQEALEALSEEQREAIVLHVYAGLSLQQAAEVAGVPLQTLASRYRRGLGELRGVLGSLR